MLSAAEVQEVERLLAEGRLSQRRIAKQTGVSRATIGAIASGSRPDYVELRRLREANIWQPIGPPQRCPGCGGTVFLPCRLCYVRGWVVERAQRGRAKFDPRQGDVSRRRQSTHHGVRPNGLGDIPVG